MIKAKSNLRPIAQSCRFVTDLKCYCDWNWLWLWHETLFIVQLEDVFGEKWVEGMLILMAEFGGCRLIMCITVGKFTHRFCRSSWRSKSLLLKLDFRAATPVNLLFYRSRNGINKTTFDRLERLRNYVEPCVVIIDDGFRWNFVDEKKCQPPLTSLDGVS